MKYLFLNIYNVFSFIILKHRGKTPESKELQKRNLEKKLWF